MLIKILNVSRKYAIKGKEDFYALKNVTLMFASTGFVSIVGRSGSGKSTLLNLIGRIDKESSGEIIIDNKSISNLKGTKLSKYYKDHVGILFQQYNLLEDETVLFNVMLPLLINGRKVKETKTKAEELLKQINIKEELFCKKASLLSGGEKQRVALARSIINEPQILLCDEPTGALDSENSIGVMEILKTYSSKHLVIMVSHNLQLTNNYSDRVIELSNGRVKSDKNIKKTTDGQQSRTRKVKNGSKWIDKLAFTTVKRHIKRNVFASIALSISLIFSFLAFGYINGKDSAIEKASLRQLDFGVGTLSKEEKLTSGKILSLARTTRPKIEDIADNEWLTNNFEFALNFDSIVPQNPSISYDGTMLDGFSYLPIYDFDEKHINSNLIIDKINTPYTIEEAYINKKAYEELKNKLGKDPLGEFLLVSNQVNTSYVDVDGTYIYDEFNFHVETLILGVVDELNYLNTPKIYYSYISLYNFLEEQNLENLTTYFNKDISWVNRIEECENYDILSSYSIRLFPKNVSGFDCRDYKVHFQDNLSYSSSSLLVMDSLINFMDVAKYGILLFLAIALIGTVLILGIISFTSYSEDRKKSAILASIGAKSSEIMDIYVNESLTVGLFSLALSLISSFFLARAINTIIEKYVDIKNLIDIPIRSLFNMPFLFPLIALIATLLVVTISTCIPIMFSKRISLKEELQSL